MAQWQTQLAREIKDGHGISAMIGRGGRTQMDFADWGRVGGRLRGEYGRLNSLALEITAGNLSDAQIKQRAFLLAEGPRSAYFDAKRTAEAEAEMVQERRLLGHVETTHCQDCMNFAAEGWQSIGHFPPPGIDSDCRHNCKCRMEFRGLDEAQEGEAKRGVEFTGDNLNRIQQQAVERGTKKVAQIYKGDVGTTIVGDRTMRGQGGIVGEGGIRLNPDLFNAQSLEQPDYITRYKRTKARANKLRETIDNEKDNWSQVDIDNAEKRYRNYLKQAEEAKSSSSFGEYSTSKTMEDVVIHEHGHNVHGDMVSGVFDDIPDFLPPSQQRALGLDPTKQLGMKLDTIAKEDGAKLSEYSTTNGEEYFAEAWTKYVNGKTAGIDKDLLEVFKKISK